MELHLQGMPSNLLEQATQRLPRRFQQRSSDVFALVKAFVSDTCLSQPPLLILPGDTVSDCVEPAMAKLAVGEAPRSLIYYTEKRQFTLT